MFTWIDKMTKKKHMRAGAMKTKLSWNFNKNVLNSQALFLYLRPSSNCCLYYGSLGTLSNLNFAINVSVQ